jgi:enoyl-CoA hydratase/carnithine racemase
MTVRSELVDGALVLTLDRPEAGNSLNPAMGLGFIEALSDAATNPAIRSVIVTGAGEKIFCAGMDLKAFAAGEDMTPVATGLAMLASCRG